MTTAIYPGSFDPVTLGHLNIISRAAAIFDRVVVCIMVNSSKTPYFTLEERRELMERVTKDLPNVTVDTSDLLLAAYAAQFEGAVLVKGIRNFDDYESEKQMAAVNHTINPQLETVFLPADEKYNHISSTIVKELARYGCDLTGYVPGEILEDVVERQKKVEEMKRGNQ